MDAGPAKLRRSEDPSAHVQDADAPAAALSAEKLLKTASQAAVIGIFLLMFGALLSIAESLFAPVVAAAVLSTLFRTLSVHIARFRIPAAVYAFLCVIVFMMAANVVIALLAGTISDWVGRAPEIGEALKTKADILERPIAALRSLHHEISTMLGGAPQEFKFELPTATLIAPVMAFLTPAVGELVIFIASLFFFIYGRDRQRHFIILMFRGHKARLRVLRTLNEIEQSLTGFIGTVTLINIALGVVTAILAYLCGLPNALFLGVLAFVLNYIPYLGAAVVTAVLFLFGLTSTPTLGTALIAPAIFVAINTIEGNFITPNVVTRQLMVGPLTTFLSLAFWTWLWGPLGAFLATPILIVLVLVRDHLLRGEEGKLPE